MSARIDYTGKKYWRLAGVKYSYSTKDGQAVWQWQCDCGRYCYVRAKDVRRGVTQSCGCLKRETSAERYRKDGPLNGDNPAYLCWKMMQQRCSNPNEKSYARYGGKGIKVCDRWKSFCSFLKDMGPRPSPEHTIDRFPNREGNYEPTNCRWATHKEQSL